jgi:hypothetical protein
MLLQALLIPLKVPVLVRWLHTVHHSLGLSGTALVIRDDSAVGPRFLLRCHIGRRRLIVDLNFSPLDSESITLELGLCWLRLWLPSLAGGRRPVVILQRLISLDTLRWCLNRFRERKLPDSDWVTCRLSRIGFPHACRDPFGLIHVPCHFLAYKRLSLLFESALRVVVVNIWCTLHSCHWPRPALYLPRLFD